MFLFLSTSLFGPKRAFAEFVALKQYDRETRKVFFVYKFKRWAPSCLTHLHPSMTELYFPQDLDKAFLPDLLEDSTFKAPFTFSAPTKLYGESDPDDSDTDSDSDSDIEPLHLNDEPYLQVDGFSYPRTLFR